MRNLDFAEKECDFWRQEELVTRLRAHHGPKVQSVGVGWALVRVFYQLFSLYLALIRVEETSLPVDIILAMRPGRYASVPTQTRLGLKHQKIHMLPTTHFKETTILAGLWSKEDGRHVEKILHQPSELLSLCLPQAWRSWAPAELCLDDTQWIVKSEKPHLMCCFLNICLGTQAIACSLTKDSL